MREDFIYIVRNDEFVINGNRAFCKIHPQEELFHRQFDIENQDKAFQLYREEYDIISPDEIKKLRDKYNLNQREFSQLLGFGEITISRYERGSLPTLAQNQIIKDSTDPNTMLKLLEKNSEKISETKSNELKIILENLLQENKYEERIISTIRDIFHHDPDIYIVGTNHLILINFLTWFGFFLKKIDRI